MTNQAQPTTRPRHTSNGVGHAQSPDVTGQVLDELMRRQEQLEDENAELLRTQRRLLASRARYIDLYSRAPVGHFTLNHAGLIQKANLTAARLLGVGTGDLARQPLSRFVLAADQDTYHGHRRRLIETGIQQACELRVLRRDGEPCWRRPRPTTPPGRSCVTLS